jgi:putative hemolysin
MPTNLVILLILLILSGFFSAAEIAFVSLTRANLGVMRRKKIIRSELIYSLKKNPRRLLITILIGNNIVNIAAASLATIITKDIFQSAVIGITTGVMTILVLIFGEIIPKSYAANHNKRFCIFAAPYLKFLQIIMLPVIIMLEWLTNKVAGKQKIDQVSEDELKALAYLGVKQGTIEHDERAMIERLFSLNDIKAEDVMTARENIISIKQSLTIDTAADLITNTSHTRFPIIDKTIDNIIGFVHSRDVLIAVQDERHNSLIKNIVHPIIRTGKNEKLDDLLKEFQRENIHMAVVAGEKGKTLGVVTLEDVLEELVGEITDEHDRP